MNLSGDALAQLVRIVDQIYDGSPAPRVRGPVGEFLRGCHRGRLDVQHVLARQGLRTRERGWVLGDEVGALDLRLLGPLEAAVPSDTWGPVESAPALSEQIGLVAELTLWTEARAANQVKVLLTRDEHATVRLTGRYRWFAPSRVTPGESSAEATDGAIAWETARCLKAVAEDVGRPPHPLEYVLDYRLGKPGLKVFRVFAGRRSGAFFEVLPVSTQGLRRVELAAASPGIEAMLGNGSLCLVFASREPWDETWHVIEAKQTTEQGCIDHAVTWADFRAEVRGEPRVSHRDLGMIRTSLAAVGVASEDDQGVGEPNLSRMLLPPAASVLRWFRYRQA